MGCWKRGYYYSKGHYVGSGEFGLMAAAFDAEDRREQDKVRALEQADRQAFQEARQQAARVDTIVCRGLTAAGFWRPGRHPWRRKQAMTTAIQSQAVQEATCELSAMAERCYIQAICGKSTELVCQLEVKLQALRADLVGPGPSCAALRLAVDAAVMAWLDKWFTELTAAHKALKIAPAVDRRRSWSQRRFLASLVTVERIRRLTRPRAPKYAVQIVNHATALDVDGRTLVLEQAS